MVIGSSAEQCSHSVLGIMSLISPITYHGDFRPYFTVYDDDFKHFCNLHDRDMLPPLLLGVTNPFFLKVMPKFPHILILSNSEENDSQSSSHSISTSTASSSISPSSQRVGADESNGNALNLDDINHDNLVNGVNGQNAVGTVADDSHSVVTIHVKTSSVWFCLFALFFLCLCSVQVVVR